MNFFIYGHYKTSEGLSLKESFDIEKFRRRDRGIFRRGEPIT